ncbi:MAG TPA: GNAT family N-acetyltransferase [Planctomycetota bacterium]
MNVEPVTSKSGMEAFIQLPFRLYKQDPKWVPPLLSVERKMLDPRRNPFYDHSEARHFLATSGARVVGRISAIVNRLHNDVQKDRTGFWGYFECENEPGAAKALFEAAEGWLREKGLTRSLGPVNPSINDPCGLLIDGFGWSPFVLMTYNPPFYPAMVEANGYRKSMDLLAWILIHDALQRMKIDRVVEMVRKRSNVTLRPMNLSRFNDEIKIVQEIYNDGWENNWGFVPMTNDEVRFMAEDLKPVLLPWFASIAEIEGRPVGFAFALPDINVALKKCGGSLLPFGWRHFLKSSLAKIPTCRIVALGIRKEYQRAGLGTLFYRNFIDEGLARGYHSAELSWILETNDLMNRPIKAMGATHYKTYRLYEKNLESRI